MVPLLVMCSVALFISQSKDEVLPFFHMNRKVTEGKGAAPLTPLPIVSTDSAETPRDCVVHGTGSVPFSAVMCQRGHDGNTFLANTMVILRKLPPLEEGNFSHTVIRKLHLLKLMKEQNSSAVPFVVYVGTPSIQRMYQSNIFLRRLHTMMAMAAAQHNAAIMVAEEHSQRKERAPAALCVSQGRVVDADSTVEAELSPEDFTMLRNDLRERVLTTAYVKYRPSLLRQRKSLAIKLFSDNATIQRLLTQELSRFSQSIKYSLKVPTIPLLASPRLYAVHFANALFVLMPGTVPFLLTASLSLSSHAVVLLTTFPEDPDAYSLLSRSVKSVTHLTDSMTQKDISWSIQECIGNYMSETE